MPRNTTPTGVRRGPKAPWDRPAPRRRESRTPPPSTLEQLQARLAEGAIADFTPAEWVLLERARKRNKLAPLIAEAKQEFEALQTVLKRRGRPKKSTTTGAIAPGAGNEVE